MDDLFHLCIAAVKDHLVEVPVFFREDLLLDAAGDLVDEERLLAGQKIARGVLPLRQVVHDGFEGHTVGSFGQR